ncbi:MAG: flavin reductase family protein [Firmicutes bacterium]|nr:flavin reductase family protein [Bacillota bacterium]
MKQLAWNAKMKEAVDAMIEHGAFLTTKVGDEQNTMAIGWGSIGYCWGKPVFTVVVRNSRHTFQLMEKAEEFTVSIPFSDAMKKEIEFCGTKSGKDVNKFEACNLAAIDGQAVKVPVIGGCDLYYECRILAKLRLEPENLHESCDEWYPKKDYHTFYVGEIMACYEKE